MIKRAPYLRFSIWTCVLKYSPAPDHADSVSSIPKMALLESPAGGNQNRAPGILALTWIAFSISLIAVALRMFTRAVIVRHVGLDDVFIVVTLVSSRSI